MAKRRGNKEGYIHQRKNGSWRVQLYHQGKRLSFTANTKRECQQWLEETRKLFSDGASIESLTIKVHSFLKLWLKNKKGTVSDKVYNQYAQVTRDYITPNIGAIKLRDITPLKLISLYNQQLRNKRNKIVGWRTKRLIHTILHQAFQDATIWGYLTRNPAHGISPPKRDSKEIRILSPSNASQLLATAQLINDPLYPFIHTALNSGMRLSELKALRWDDIKMESHTIRVDKQIKRKKGGGFIFTPPKTEAGKRTIELGQETIAAIKVQREMQYKQMSLAGDDWQDHNLIFTTSRGTPLQSKYVRRRFYALLEKAGVPKIRFHDLRHTAASLMLNSGIPVIIVSKRLGHSSVSVTLDTYGHFIPEMQQGIGDTLDKLISPVKVKIAPKLHQDVG